MASNTNVSQQNQGRVFGLPSILWTCILLFLIWTFLQTGVPVLARAITGQQTANLSIHYVFGSVEFENVGVGAPLPSSLVRLYFLMSVIGTLLYVSITDEGLKAFLFPLRNLLLAERSVPLVAFRYLLVGVIALFLTQQVYGWLKTDVLPPAELRTVHPSLPNKYLEAKNPFPWTPENIAKGQELYITNCSWCHGDRADGQGPVAQGFTPSPIDFTDAGTIAQLPENYLYWRIKEGGAGLPSESWPWSSAMPSWNPTQAHQGVEISALGRLEDNDIWLIIMGAYSLAGQTPAKRD